MLTCFLGAVIVATELQFQSYQLTLPVLSTLIAAVAWGFLLIIITKSEQEALLITGVSFLWGALFTWFFGFWTGQSLSFPQDISEWLWLFYLGVIPTAVAVGLWAIALRMVGRQTQKIITLEYFTPVISVAACVLLLQEILSPMFLIGFVLIVGGNFFSGWNK